jgi:hypothetical protein
MYAVVKIGYELYSVGKTEREAITIAKQWMDDPDTPVKDYTPAACAGSIVVIPCTQALVDAVESDLFVDVPFDIIDGVADLYEEE